MGELRYCTFFDDCNPDIPRDELLNTAGILYLQLGKYNDVMSFEAYYEVNFNHERVYKSWKE